MAEAAGSDVVGISDHFHPWLEDARIFDLPQALPLMPVAASGQLSARIAAELGTGRSPPSPRATRSPGSAAPGRATPGWRWPGRPGRRPQRPDRALVRPWRAQPPNSATTFTAVWEIP